MMTFKDLAKLLVASGIGWDVVYLELRKMTLKTLKKDIRLCPKRDITY